MEKPRILNIGAQGFTRDDKRGSEEAKGSVIRQGFVHQHPKKAYQTRRSERTKVWQSQSNAFSR